MFCPFYLLQTRLREGSVFTGVCLFTGEGVGTLYASWTYPTPFGMPYLPGYTLTPRHTLSPLRYPIPPGFPISLLLTSGDHLWRPVSTCLLKALSSTPLMVLTSSGDHQSGRYAYWNAVSFLLSFRPYQVLMDPFKI